MPGEGFGVAAFVGGLVVFVTVVGLAVTCTLDDVIVWVLSAQTVAQFQRMALTVAGLAVLVALVTAGKAMRAASAHVHGGRRRHVVRHEAAHAAVAHGVGAGGITAQLKPGGGGKVTCDVNGMSPAEYVAYMRAGKAVAPGDCHRDDANARRELDRAPAGERARISREADAIVARHVRSGFGQRVARALERDGRF